ncbi:LPXTG cell wall anchor domain-containing protein [Lentilactobacillus sp. SPB1-3]|uniref:LPXTG cell wall anchor domain-containing protein n=1 Tax=Lentilactobacillus terminaliae TaxID=3003483 RepID=A0ACD5DDL9_9LACO|nr:LPXTG cell wall anchor domain-containing protein [Lentilactobacillus sp. SPB1-3]MCZ0977684.1 LPXTG cell wall anchor domain-containing protein [Lentilactobacillus sp. SPB1-3]
MKKNGCNYRGLLASTVFLSAGVLLTTIAPVNAKADNNANSVTSALVSNKDSNTSATNNQVSIPDTNSDGNSAKVGSSTTYTDNNSTDNDSVNEQPDALNSNEGSNNTATKTQNDDQTDGQALNVTNSNESTNVYTSPDASIHNSDIAYDRQSNPESSESNLSIKNDSVDVAANNGNDEKINANQPQSNETSQNNTQVQSKSTNVNDSGNKVATLAYSSPVTDNSKYEFKASSVATVTQGTQWAWLPVPILIPGRIVDGAINTITSIPGLSGLSVPLNAIRTVLTPSWAIALNSASGAFSDFLTNSLTSLFPNNDSIQTILGELENPLIQDSLPIQIFLPIPIPSVTPPTTPETPVTPPTTPETPVTPPTTPETPVTPPTTPETPVTPPTTPETPVTPPTTPKTPVTPPTTPETPVTPPTTPETPVTPPTTPKTPVIPTINKSVTTLTKISKKVTTVNVTKQGNTDKQNVNNKIVYANSTKLPQTGESSKNSATLVALGVGMLVAALGLAYKTLKRN